ncbi:MAG: HlyC/CorC family transporter [Prevotella sp.]|nr:HlyC/CorC family transporter [Prevotella sp.]
MVLSAFFSGMEIAFVASNRLLMKVGKDQSGLSQHCLKVFYANPNSFVSTMLVGNNIVLVVYGILFARIFDGLWQLAGISNDATLVMLDSICSTLVILFTGEFLPKTLFKSNPNRLMNLLAPVAYLFYIVLWPISRFSTLLSRLFLRLLDEVDDEMKIFQNALDFPDLKVRDCMVPRTEINAVPYDCTADELQQKFVESGNSKILIYKEDIDHIVGYIHTLELFRAREKWHDHIRQMPFVPETMAAQKLMQIFLGQKKSIGGVVDEFGGTSGIVSLEDIVEEIFGDIEDEHDNTNYIAKQTADGDYILSGRLEIDKANELFNLGLPDSGEYKTISGLILHAYQSFPKLNEVVKVGKYHFKIVKKTMTKIEVVRLHVAEE